MKFIADLHIHSKYSRATSPNMTLEELDRRADDKGILVMGTGDFTHPKWFKEIKKKLEPAEPGLFKLKKEYKKTTLKNTLAETRFILTVEISGIFSRPSASAKNGKKTYRVHNLVFSPDIKTAEKINKQLSLIGNLKSDGRPILGLDSEKLAEIVFNINPKAAIIPAHAWTPWFSIFGSMSGFDSIEECFGKYAKNIFAIETGLSSDPSMNWRLSKLDNIALISNSDSHSAQKIGREANIFDTELSYKGIMEAIKSGAPINRRLTTNDQRQKFTATIEFFPEEGKYHYDGHRLCGVIFSPKETKKHNGICPKCRKPLTIGVMNRINELTDREINVKTEGNYHEFNSKFLIQNSKLASKASFVPYYNLVSLNEIIAEAREVGIASKKVKTEYENLIKKFGSELKILLETNLKELGSFADDKIVESVKRVREGKLKIRPGFDGEYGKVKIF